MNSCVITGSAGFVGSSIKKALERHSWRAPGWSRRFLGEINAIPFRLGQPVDAHWLNGSQALVHCAYDFAPSRWEEIVEINVKGSLKLFAAARKAGIERIVFISTLSAFPGCRSKYGNAKLQIEEGARALGAWVVRPGLVYGTGPGGVFGRLVRLVRRARVLPVLWGGRQWQYLVHEADLALLVLRILEGKIPEGTEPLSAAHQRPWHLAKILRTIEAALHKRVCHLPVPWQAAWLGLRACEGLGWRPGFGSDNLISMIYQNPKPDFSALERLGVSCRPFELEAAMLNGC